MYLSLKQTRNQKQQNQNSQSRQYIVRYVNTQHYYYYQSKRTIKIKKKPSLRLQEVVTPNIAMPQMQPQTNNIMQIEDFTDTIWKINYKETNLIFQLVTKWPTSKLHNILFTQIIHTGVTSMQYTKIMHIKYILLYLFLILHVNMLKHIIQHAKMHIPIFKFQFHLLRLILGLKIIGIHGHKYNFLKINTRNLSIKLQKVFIYNETQKTQKINRKIFSLQFATG
eukprot:TRINITY_DN1815_c0_g2_i1.p2 TRINITY_DN1815_c0_g2~~TRINITY_DN1815_c0_g2_i1.p2  ORF type:complete len:224 (+),score=-30.83 TRINITY_DN1815_c0_g2_i1:135-806(+)